MSPARLLHREVDRRLGLLPTTVGVSFLRGIPGARKGRVYCVRLMPTLIAQYGVLVVALIIFAGEVGIPTLVPGEIAILIAGSQVVHSVPQLIGTMLLFGTVDIIACSTIHLASRTGGNRLLLRLLRKVQPHHDRHEEVIEGWRRRLGGRDQLVVFVTRLIPLFRLYASITTGLIRIRFRHFVGGAVPARRRG